MNEGAIWWCPRRGQCYSFSDPGEYCFEFGDEVEEKDGQGIPDYLMKCYLYGKVLQIYGYGTKLNSNPGNFQQGKDKPSIEVRCCSHSYFCGDIL